MTLGMPIADKMEHQATQLIATLKPFVAAVHAHLQTYRIPLTALAAIVFVGGAVWSFSQLGLSFADLNLGAAAILAALVPLSLLYGGFGLVLLARMARTSIPLGKAIPFSIYAALAEALPLPGGAIVRTGALVSSGARIVQSSVLVIVTAVLWVALAAAGAGLFLVSVGEQWGLVLAALGSTAVVGICLWLLSRTGLKITFLMLVHRLVGMLLMAIRLKIAFLVLGSNLSLANTLPFAFASIAGSAAAIAPAGLGISESLSALLANVAATTPAAAFLAVALSRIVGLIVTAIAATLVQFDPKSKQFEEVSDD